MDSSDRDIAPHGPGEPGLTDALRKLAPDTHVLNALHLITETHLLVSATDRAGRIIYANDRFCEVSKYAREELIGQTHSVLRSGHHPSSFYEDMWDTITSGRVWTGDIQNKARDGSLYWVQSTISPVLDGNGEIVGYASVRTDVTDRRKLVSELRSKEKEAYEALMTAMGTIDSSLSVIDGNGRIVITNDMHAQMYPESAELEKPGAPILPIIRERRSDLTETELHDYIRGLFTTNTTEHRQLSDGRTVQVRRTLRPGGGYVSLHTDVTDVVRQAELFERQAETLDLMMAVAVDANESGDVRTAFSRCLKRICEYTGWDVGHSYISCEDGSGDCEPAGSWCCADGGRFTAFKQATQGLRLESGKGLPGQVFAAGEPVWLRDVTQDANFPRREAAKAAGLVGGAAFPVKIRDEVVAVVEFYSSTPMERSEELEGVLAQVCAQVARVAERNRMEKALMARVSAELRKRDRELVEQNERFDAALKNMSQGLCMFDKDQRLIVSNERYAQMYDLPPEIMKPGITLRQILEHRIQQGIFAEESPEDYIEERMAWVTSGVRASKIQHLNDGRVIAISHQPMPGGGWVTTHEDITEHMQSQKALQESQELLDKAFRASPAALAISDPEDGSHIDVNETWSNMLGYSREEAMAHSALELGIWAEPSERARFVEQIMRDGSLRGLEAKFRTKGGRHLDVLISGECVEIGGKLRLLVSAYDLTERIRSERALRESQELLGKAFRASPAAMAISTPEDGFHIDVNETWTTTFGYSREEALAKTAGQLETWVDPEARVRFVRQLEKDGSVKGFETALRTKDGRLLEVLMFGERVEITGKQCMLVVTHDITERKKAERALRDSEARFKTLVETTNVVPWEFDPATMRFTYVGPQAVAMFGYPAEAWYEDGFWTGMIHPDDREKAVRICMDATRCCKDHDFEYRVLTAYGTELWVRDVVSVVVENGEVTSLRGVLIDVSERKRASEALKESEQRFKDIVEISSDWIWECDENLRFTYLSERFEEVTGVACEKILGRTRYEVGRESEADWESHMADLEARRPFREFSYSVMTENGRRHWSISGRPVFDTNGVFKGYRGTGADRTAEVEAEAELIRHRDHLQDLVNDATAELKERAEELRQALAKEKELNDLQRQFVSMASHEFRTPLAIIDSTAQRLQRRASELQSDDTRKRVERIRNAVGRMTQLMESTLVAARLESGRPSIQAGPCDIGELLAELCTRQQELAEKHVITCSLGDLPDTIQADAGALEQVFTNLLSNAVKYAPDTPEILVTASCEGEEVVVGVRDHGVGIDEDDMPNMFQRFFRAKTSAGIAGTGIGLNLVKTLVELHEGSITVESRKGEGSLFTVRLPVAGPRQAQETGEQAA